MSLESSSSSGVPLTARELQRGFPDYRDQLAHVETVPADEGTTADPREVLREDLAGPLKAAVGDLYSHQVEALERLAVGDNVCVTTATASGKTYVYALQIARNALDDPNATALLVAPTKALARDQQQALVELFGDLGLDITVRVYDGDTPRERRPRIREKADVIISNFVGLNVYLGHHAHWLRMFDHCELLVIDETHTYTGVHGMHVAWTIRRLRRLLEDYGSDPQMVCTSATIGNPAHHAKRLTGATFTVVDEDGSPHGSRDIVFWQPAVQQRGEPADDQGGRASALREAGGLLAHFGSQDVQTLLFTRSRQQAELAVKEAERAARRRSSAGIQLEPYHAGLGRDTRRDIEYRFKTGQLDGVASTNALELGIDIGTVGATILTSYPGTRQSFWQQVGRAGRGEADALSVLVARSDALDQYLFDHPEYVLGEAIEDAVVGLENNPVYAKHLLCAAHERPLKAADREWFDGDRLDRAVDMWRAAGQLEGDLSRNVRYTGTPRPQGEISMYGTSGKQFDVRCPSGDIDMPPVGRERAYREHHPGAIFLQGGVQYEVVGFEEDGPNPHLTVQPVRTTDYTETTSEKTVRGLSIDETRDLGDGYRIAKGAGTVEIHYTQYQRKDIVTGRATSPLQPTGLPPIELTTDLMWVETPAALCDEVLQVVAGTEPSKATEGEVKQVFGGGLHGAEHGMIKLAPLQLLIDSGDLGGLSTPLHEDTGVPTWFIHDATEGGLGFSHHLYENVGRIARHTRDRVARCDCAGTDGCPSCIMDSQCGNRNRFLHTDATVEILDRVLERLSRQLSRTSRNSTADNRDPPG